MKTMTLTTLTLASITAVLVFGQMNSPEPRYRDKKLTAWLNDLNCMEPSTWRQAETAVRSMGTNALPVLAKRLQGRDSALKLKLIEFCENYPLMTLAPAELHHGARQLWCHI